MMNSIRLKTKYNGRFYLKRTDCTAVSLKKIAGALLCICIMLSLTVSTMVAQNSGKISGVVLDAQNSEPLIGANVVILGTSMGGSTDLEGSFFILNVPVGKYEVQASMIGYSKVTKTDVIVSLNKTTSLDFKVPPTAVMEKDVIIEAIRPIVEKEKTSTSTITRSDEIKELAGMHSAGDVLALSADVTDGHFRGGRSGEVLYTLQGMGTLNPLDNSNTLDPIMSAVEEVEVVTSGFGAQYGNAQSGIVNVSMKEGKTDKWRSFVDVHVSAAGKKHFGNSPWDVSANPYLKYLMNFDNWTKANMLTFGRDITSNQDGPNCHVLLCQDTVAMQKFSYALYRQLNNNVNRSYGDKPDYSAEISTGGPLNESMRLFIAANTKVSWPVLATEQPDENYQIMGNIVTDVGKGDVLRLNTSYSQNNQNIIETDDNSYLGFLYNMLTGIDYQRKTNYQLGLRYTGSLSQSTFYEVKLNGLSTRKQLGGRSTVVDSLIGAITTNSYWLAKQTTSLAGYSPSIATKFQDDKTQTVSLDASITSQLTKAHLINAGIQTNLYFVDIYEYSGANIFNGLQSATKYYSNPIEASVYAQDKMEFEGMIANVGLRLDLWSMRSDHGSIWDSLYTKDQNTKVIARIQPRAGFSFPVSENAVFHVNYGSYIQRPSFQYLVREQQTAPSGKYVPNPALRPQTTNSYDLGIMQALGEDFTLDVSGYYKNVSDLVKQVKITTNKFNSSQSIYSYINYDYADIRGFRVSLVKRKGNLTGSVNYTYSVNTGSSSSPGAYEIDYTMTKEGSSAYITSNSANIPSTDVLLDYDRTHNLVVNVAYKTDNDFGFRIGDTYPLADMAFSVSSTATSGRPFTYSTTGSTEWMNMRMPAEYNTDVKLSKRVTISGVALTFYAEVFNLFDNKIFNYDYLTSESQITKRYLEGNYGNNSGNLATSGLVYFDPQASTAGNIINQGYDQSFIVYSNQPRSYWFGVNVEF